MEKRIDWREEVYREFSFLYARGYTLSKALHSARGAYAVFSSDKRQIAIRWDEANRVYVQIYKRPALWGWTLKQPQALNVFEVAKAHPSGHDVPFEMTGTDYPSVFRKNAEFMERHLGDVIDGKVWLEK